MVFSSLEFIFLFLPAFLAVYALAPKKHKNAVIFLGSVIFYSFGVADSVYVGLFLMTILVNFILGQFIGAYPKNGRIWLVIGIIFNFWWLVFFKYSGFILTNVNDLTGGSLTVKNIILPIGISFYTFQNVSYIIDVYRGDAKPEKNFINYGAYITMFPQLIAGPIVKYKTVADQLRNRRHSAKRVEEGLKTFTIGLGYKVLIANRIGTLWNDIHNIGYSSISPRLAWMGIFAYSFQLYFDFCGYSNMAIGLGSIMGFDIPVNFDNPYMSTTMGEFWRRWHMTLGSWFREYIYIPLGGSRVSNGKIVRNYLVVWLFTGIWHGASWNYVIWGLVLFGLIMLERFVIGETLTKYKPLGHLYMIMVIPLTWLIFAVTDFHQLGIYFTRLFPFLADSAKNVNELDYAKYWGIYGKYFLCGLLFSTSIPGKIYKSIKNSLFSSLLLLAVFLASVYCLYKGMDNPFMYYKF